MPPGKYGVPVAAASTSAAARLKVLCPETKPGKEGVTNVAFWYGTQRSPRIQPTPLPWVGSFGGPRQVRIAISPTWPARSAWRCPGAEDSRVIRSISPGINGRPSGSYEGRLGSLDCPRPARERIIEIG